MSALINQSIPVGFTREEPNKQISLVFDCAGSGVKNIDLDNMQFMINSFKEDYPWCLNYILVYEMPWVMNGTGAPLLLDSRVVTRNVELQPLLS